MEDSPTSVEKTALNWEDHHVQYLFDCMLEQARIPGMKVSGGLKKVAMKKVERCMITEFGPEFTLEKIKNKLKRAKPNLSIMNEMLNTNGFGWDPEQKILVVENAIWAEYVKKYPDRKKYKKPATWKYYEPAVEIWGKSATLGNHKSAISSRPISPMDMPDPPSTVPDEASQTHLSGEHLTAFTPSAEPSLSSRNKRKAASDSQQYSDMLTSICKYVKNVSDATPYHLTQRCSQIVSEMFEKGEINKIVYVRSIEFLCEPKNATTFLCILPTIRSEWLREKIQGL